MVRLLPTDQRFFPWLAELAEHLIAAATLLRDVFAEPERKTELVWKIKQIEAKAAQQSRNITEQVTRTFVPPLDSEDIHTLTLRLALAVDMVEDAAQRAEMFQVAESQEAAWQLADILLRSANILNVAVANLEDTDTIRGHVSAIKALEEEADALHARAVGALFAGSTAVMDVIRWKDIYDALEDAVDQCEDVADTLTSIALKNS